jgi:hypothetical protein
MTGDTLRPVMGGGLVRLGGEFLLCPRCGADKLRQGRVVLYLRREGDPSLLRLTISTGGTVTKAKVASDEAGNPSERRHGLAIRLTCERCGGRSELTLAQHTGATLMRWREPPDGQAPAPENEGDDRT